MRRGMGRIGTATVVTVALLGGAPTGPASAAPPAAPPPAVAPGVAPAAAAGSVLQTGEFFSEAFDGPQADMYRFTGRGDGLSTNWSVAVDSFTLGACAGVNDSISLIGLMNRDGSGPFGGHVGLARLYTIRPSNQQYAPVRDLTGAELLACLRQVAPDLPDGTAFTLAAADRVQQFWPAGAGASDGTFDLVSFTANFGYMVNQYVPGRGWRPGASIGGSGSDPSVVRQRDGALRIFVAGGGGHLYSATIGRDRRFSGWRNLGGSIQGNADPVVSPDGTVNAYVIGADNRILKGRVAPGGAFGGWTSLGRPPPPTGQPEFPFVPQAQVAAVGTGGGRVTVVTSNGFDLFTKSYANGHWGPWTLVATPPDVVFQDGIAGASAASGQATLVWASQPPAFNAHTSTLSAGRWSRPVNLAGGVGRLFATAIGNRIDVWTQGGNGMYQRTFRAGHWTPRWTRLPISSVTG